MEDKLKLIKNKERFYTAVAVKCGKSVDTMTTKWFNQKNGFSIPKEYIPTVESLFDMYLGLEDRVAKFEQKELEKIKEK